jgi:Uma2 family endonuclease
MATKTRVSLDEFLALPGIDVDRLELLDGEVSEKPMPTWGHGRIAGKLFAVLDEHGYAAVEPRAVIPETADRRGSSPIPDVAFYVAAPPPDDEWMRRPPDIAIEVLSPGQSRQEIRAKSRPLPRVRCPLRLGHRP